MSAPLLTETALQVGALFWGEPALAVTPILGKGRINRIFLVRGAGGEIVVRINDLIPTPAAAVGYATEAWCLEQAARVGVPGPSCLRAGACDGHAYLVQSRVPGENAADRPAEKAPVWEEIGRYARLIHGIDITVGGHGPQGPPESLFGPLSVTGPAAWLRQIEEAIGALSDPGDPLRGRVYPQDRRAGIIALLEGLKALPFRAGLNHGDLALTNAMIDQDGGVSLLDWGSALVHTVPHYDLSQMLKNQVAADNPDARDVAAFLAGYGVPPSDRQAVCAQALAVLLLRSFAKARWALGCGHPNAPDFASLAERVGEMAFSGG